MRILAVLLLMCGIAWAEDIQLTDDFTLHKPNIESDKTLTTSEQTQVDNALKKQGRILIHNELKPAKNDYQSDFDRGTVYYTNKCKNYSYHKVIIPDKTVVSSSNFTQRLSKTSAISGKNLKFVECNLVNNLIDPTWVLENCNTSEHDFSKDEEIK